MKKLPKPKSAPEELLSLQLRAEKIKCHREVLVVDGRRWKLDFHIDMPNISGLAVEVEGWGRHQRWKGFEDDCEKYAHALIAGWHVLRVTPTQIRDGRALAWIKALI